MVTKEKKKVKAIALLSGGLDSTLAIKLIRDQGIEAIVINVAVLLVLSVVVFAFAAWRFKYE